MASKAAALAVVDRQIDRNLLRQQSLEGSVHAALRIADRHGAGRIAMIGAAERQNAVAAATAAIEPVLHRHLQRDFDSHRTGIAEEDAIEFPWGGECG